VGCRRHGEDDLPGEAARHQLRELRPEPPLGEVAADPRTEQGGDGVRRGLRGHGDHDDRWPLLQRPGGGGATRGHADVEQHHVGVGPGHDLEQLDAVDGLADHGEAGIALHDGAQHLADHLVVVRDDDPDQLSHEPGPLVTPRPTPCRLATTVAQPGGRGHGLRAPRV
jgi:hypothetical protein